MAGQTMWPRTFSTAPSPSTASSRRSSTRTRLSACVPADALEEVSAHRPDLLLPHKERLLALLPTTRQPELRWHLAQILPRLPLTTLERAEQAVPALLNYLQDCSRIVQTFALQALADFATIDSSLRPEVSRLVHEAMCTGSAAVKSRARRLFVQLKSLPGS